MSSQEFIRNCVASKDMDDDWTFDDAVNAGLVNLDDTLKQEVDLRIHNPWWKINNQGLDTGSCVGWAVGDSVLRYHFVQQKLLKPEQRLSVRYLWMAAKEFDEDVKRPTVFIEEAGTSLKTALRLAQRYGVVPETVLPFKSNQLYKEKLQLFYYIASQRRINGFYNLGSGNDPENLKIWRRWLSKIGPIAIRLHCDPNWLTLKAPGNLDEYDKNTVKKGGGHAVALVGYTSDNRFIIRNSWGTQWGKKGFAFASEAYVQAAFDEAYGVIVTQELETPNPKS